MPKLTKLTEEEYRTPAKARKAAPKRLTKRQRQLNRYMKYLEPYAKGGYVEVTLKSGEKRQTEKLRLLRAAAAMGVTLAFKRTKGKLRFEVKP